MTDQQEIVEFFRQRDIRLLFGPFEKPHHTCAEPRKEYWQAFVSGEQQMVVVINDWVYHIDYGQEEWYKPQAMPFANKSDILFIRPCTSFDF